MGETVGTDFYMLDSTDNVTLGNETLEEILQKLIGIDFSKVNTKIIVKHLTININNNKIHVQNIG